MTDAWRLKVLSFTTLFPNRAYPHHGLFVKNRLAHMAHYCELTVVAPVNIANDPRTAWITPQCDRHNDVLVLHPRFAVVPGLFKHWDGELLFRQAMPQVRSRLSLDTYDVVDVHYAYPDGVAGQRVATAMNRPFVITLRGSDINVLSQFAKRRRLIQDTLKGAHAVVTVSRALASRAAELGADPRKIHVIPNGVDTDVFFPRSKPDARLQLGWPVDAHIVLAVGRLAVIKGFDLLIQAIHALRNRLRKEVRCYIVGEGELRMTLEKEIRQRNLPKEVVMPGWVSPAQLPLWYAAADLLCLSSHNEGCPNVVLESLACGTPVVATDVGGVSELIHDGVTGRLVPHRSVEELSRCIAAALETRWDQTAILRSDAVRSWSDVASTHVALLRDVARCQ